MKKWVSTFVIFGTIFFGFYFGSAYLAASNLKDVANGGDVDSIEEAVDFPSVRESLKSQMSVVLTEKMQSDPAMADNPFAGLGMVLLPAIIDKAVDVFVTPDGVARLVQGQKPNENDQEIETGDSDVNYEYEWVSVDRFRVQTSLPETGESGPALVFERRGIFSWKLIRIKLPDAMFEERSP